MSLHFIFLVAHYLGDGFTAIEDFSSLGSDVMQIGSTFSNYQMDFGFYGYGSLAPDTAI